MADAGEWVVTWQVGEEGYEASAATPDTPIDRERYRVVTLVREEAGITTEARLLRSVEWMEPQGIEAIGDRTELNLPEMGAEGEFQVLAIEECPEISPKPSNPRGRVRLVTGRFRHPRGRTLRVLKASACCGWLSRSG